MSSHASFVGSVPDLYERYLAPVFMAPYAHDLAARIAVLAPRHALEIACGTGVLTREIVRIGAAGSLVATDLNDPMLSVARGFIPAERMSWHLADATALPFGDASFDVAACQFGVMFFPDKPRAAREVRRVLRPGGTYLFSVWAGLDRNPIGRITHETSLRFFGSNPPMFCLVPFGYGDPNAIEADARTGGFTEVRIDAVDLEAHVRSAHDLAIGLVQGSPLVNAIREHTSVPVATVTEAVAEAIEKEFGTGEARAPMRALVVQAR